jgi:hypothetical protein
MQALELAFKLNPTLQEGFTRLRVPSKFEVAPARIKGEVQVAPESVEALGHE